MSNKICSRKRPINLKSFQFFIAAAIALLLLPSVSVGVPVTCTSTAVPFPNPLTIVDTHTGTFDRGSSGSSFGITVSNNSGAETESSDYITLCGAAITLGTNSVTVVNTLPAGLSAVSMAGTGWSCDLPTLTCIRTGGLPEGGSYPPITMTVDVAADAPLTMSNTAALTGTFVSHSIANIVDGVGNIIAINDNVNTSTWNPANALDTACIEHIVRMGALDYFDSLALAYTALVADTPADLYLHQTTYAAASLNTATVLSLNGGRVCDFSTVGGYSNIMGTLEVITGTLIPDRIIIL
ncbi:MAG: hypothetical protein WA610_13055 [Thermodesulfovibrionales bacterium]